MSGYSSLRLARFSQWIVHRYPPSRSARASRYVPVQIAPSGTRRWASRRSQAMQVLSTCFWTLLARANDDEIGVFGRSEVSVDLHEETIAARNRRIPPRLLYAICTAARRASGLPSAKAPLHC